MAKKRYKLTEEQYTDLSNIIEHSSDEMVQMVKINKYWQGLGKKYGFDWNTVKPICKDNCKTEYEDVAEFTAEPLN